MRERKKTTKTKRRSRVPGAAVRRSAEAASTVSGEAARSGNIFFAAAFVLSCIGIYALIHWIPASFMEPVNQQVAGTLGAVLNTFGAAVIVTSNTVSGGGLAFRIIPECTPIFTVGLFSSFIAFYPATLRQKAAGLALGVPALYAGNIARLTATFFTSSYNRNLFDLVHVYLGQVFTIATVILGCIAWLQWIDRDESKKGTPVKITGFPARFALLSGAVFLVWMKVHPVYIQLLDRCMVFGFSLFGYFFTPARQIPVYYETFSIVTFISLVLAVRSTPAATKIKQSAAGLAFLFLTHLFHRVDNFIIVLFNYTDILPIDLTLLAIGQYLLPLLLLIHSVRRCSRDEVPSRATV